MVKCECGNLRVMSLRIDSDWGTGVGNYSAINDEEHYTVEELDFDSYDKPDIDIFHCLDCNSLFE